MSTVISKRDATLAAPMLPSQLQRFAGKILDPDTHAMPPAQEWVRVMGPEFRELADYLINYGENEEQDKNSSNIPDFKGDVTPIDESIVNLKGSRAPGAFDVGRREAVMDAMGVRRQMVFPTFPGVMVSHLYCNADDPTFMPYITGDRRAKAERMFERENEWLLDWAKSERIRPTPHLFGDTPEQLINRAKHFLKRGARAVWLFPAGELPGGRSPAHPDLDPLWAMLAEANCAVVAHIGGGGRFMRTEAWQDAPAFAGFLQQGEVPRSPWFLAQIHLAFENLVTTMILGGVFDRHSKLRLGITECGAYWVGALTQRLDMWHHIGGNLTEKKKTKFFNPQYQLPEAPSFYLKRNVRVTPFVHETEFVYDIERYGLQDVLCYSSDYPHIEGGKYSSDAFYKKLAPLGDEMIEKFFVKNAEWILPD